MSNEDSGLPAIMQQPTHAHLTQTDPASVYAAETAKQRLQAAYIMARQFPRDTDQSRNRILNACKRTAFAEQVEFQKPVGGRTITGPSIRFAEVALKEWGNIQTETAVVYEDDDVRRVKVFCSDMETNVVFSKEVVIKKTVERKNAQGREVVGERVNTYGKQVFVVKTTDDELHNKEAALISKAIRNEGLRLIPKDIIDEALETARETRQAGDKKDPDAAKKKVLDAFADIGVQPKDIKEYLGHSVEQITPKELDDLKGMYRAIKDGEASWSDYVGKPEPADGDLFGNENEKPGSKTKGLKRDLEKQSIVKDLLNRTTKKDIKSFVGKSVEDEWDDNDIETAKQMLAELT